MSSLEEIRVLLGAACPIICVYSAEEDRVEAALAEILQNRHKKMGTSTPLWIWSNTQGMIEYGEGGHAHEDTDSPGGALEFIGEFGSPGVFVLRDFHHFMSAEPPIGIFIQRSMKDLARILQATGKHIVIVGNNYDIPSDLEVYVSVVEFDLPCDEEIATSVERSLKDAPQIEEVVKELSRLEDPDQMKNIVSSCKGLTLFEIDNVLAKSLVATKALDIHTILSEKKQIIKKSGVLEFYDTEASLSTVGGLSELKIWLQYRGKAFSVAAQEYGLPHPKGILIVGIPGTGKSLIAKSIGRTWNMPILRMDVGALFGSFVGQSEANMRKALKTAEALAPCILWIDELEKSMGTGSGGTDGGTTARVFGSFLSWMQEKKSPVFVVATANDVTVLPPEMLRKGRFDELFFVDLPDREARNEIFRIHLQLKGRDPSNYPIEELGLSADQFSGAEIESVIVDGLYKAFAAGRELETGDMLRAIMDTVPLAKTMGAKIDSLRKWARTRARAASTGLSEAITSKSTKRRKVNIQ